jgi:signal transduction histidine kinase/ligand-binding sensor domain-containing protein
MQSLFNAAVKVFFGIILICISKTSSYAQKEIFFDLSYSSSIINLDDGLSQGSNYFRYEDTKGFMWLTANDAVNRFDGAYIKVYNLDKYFENCPNLQQAYGITEDNRANIYMGSINGLYIYQREKDKFSLQKIYANNKEQVAMPFAFQDGKVWCFNKQFQLATYDVNTKKIELHATLPLEPLESVNPYQLPKNMFYFHMPIVDRNGTIYASSSSGIATYNTKSKKIQLPLESIVKNKNFSISASCIDTFKNCIYYCTTIGIINYNITNGKYQIFSKVGKTQLLNPFSIACNKKYIVFREDGKLMMCNKSMDSIHILKSTTPINYSWTMCLGFDKNNRLWSSINSVGQLIFDFQEPMLNKITKDHPKLNMLNNLGISRIAELPNGNIITNYGNQHKEVTDLIFNANTKEIKINRSNKSIFFYNEYMVTDRFNKVVWKFYQNLKANNTPVFLDRVKSNESKINIKIDEQSKSYGLFQSAVMQDANTILCVFETGLYNYNIINNTFEPVTGGDKKNSFMYANLSGERCAVSYLSGDMVLYKKQAKNKITKLKTILKGIQSFYIQEDTLKHNFWVASNQGLFILDTNFGIIKKIDANNGLAGTYIYGILLGDDGNIYCSHQKGLSSINTSTYRVNNFDKADGIQDWDFNNRAFLKAADGTLYFGGGQGFNYFKPPLFFKSNYKPQVYIDEILLNNTPYSTNQNSDYIKQLDLKSNQNNIVIKAFIKELANAKSIQLIYRFKNLETDFHYLQNKAEINFNNLAPDNYILQIGYFDKYAGKEIVQKEIIINIEAPFYKKLWFVALMAILSTALLFYLYNRRKFTKQKNIFDKQLALDKQRQDITADLHDDIGATLSSLQLNSSIAKKFLNKNSTKTESILETIELQAKELSEKVGDIIWSMKDEHAFGNFSDRLKTYANQRLDHTTIDYVINISPTVDDYIKDTLHKKNLIFISKEAINNAVKYSQATLLKIKCDVTNNILILKIEDNGIGFEKTDTAKFGNGLRNIRKRAEELNGELTITSSINKGTIVRISIPV